MLIFNPLLKAVSYLPLAWLHAIGAALGWLVYLVSRSYAARLSENLRQSGLFASEKEYRQLRRAAIVEAGKATVELVAGLQPSTFRRDARLVALRDPRGYPMNHGRIVSNDGLDIPAADWESMFEEHQVAWSHALQASGRDGQPYLLGPSSRVTLGYSRAARTLRRSFDVSQ